VKIVEVIKLRLKPDKQHYIVLGLVENAMILEGKVLKIRVAKISKQN
jgi:hypothetical protein